MDSISPHFERRAIRPPQEQLSLPSMLRLALRTLPLFAVIVSLAMALGAYMNFSGVRAAYTELIRSRLQVIAHELERDILSATSFGIPLTEQVTLPDLLKRQASTDAGILSIDVEDAEGLTLFSSEPSRIGTRQQPDGTSFDVALPVLNDFGAAIGRVLIRYDRTAMVHNTRTFAGAVARDALPAGLAAVLAGSIAAFLVMRQLHARARRLADGNSGDAIARAASDLRALEESN